MSLSPIAVEQREKEAKTLNGFLAFSLIGSLALHIGVLSLGISKFWSKVPTPENEPIEIAIVELPSPQKLDVTPEIAKGKGNNQSILSNAGGSGGFGVASGSGDNSGGNRISVENAPRKIASAKSSIAIAKAVQVSPTPQKLSPRISRRSPNQNTKLEKVPSEIVTQPKPIIAPKQATPSEIVTQPKPVIAPAPSPVAKTSNLPTSDRSSQVQQLTNQKLNRVLTNARNTREASKVNDSREITAQQSLIAANLRSQSRSGTETSNSSSNSAGNESRNGVTGSTNSTGIGTGNSTGTNNRGTGSGNGTRTNNLSTGNSTGRGIGNGVGNGTGRGTGNSTGKSNGTNNGLQNGSKVATGARNVERGASPGESNGDTNTGSSGRLACRTCSKPKYPESARKRKLEGKAEISVDVDRQGNVTNVRLARTSGHAELDKAAVEQARNWKFDTPNGAAQGVTAKVDFAIEGSERSRQNRERRRQRVATRKKSVNSSANTRSQTNPVATTPARQNNNTSLRRSLRRQSTATRRRVDTLPPRQAADRPQRRQSASQVRLRNSLRRAQSSSPSQTRVRRSPTTAPSQSKLRESLRLHRRSQSTPANEP